MSRPNRRAVIHAACASLALLAALPACHGAPSAAPPARQGPDALPAAWPAPMGGLVATGPADATSIALLECASGSVLARVRTPHPLAAPVVADFDSGALYAATRVGELLRYSIPELRLQVRQALAFEPTALAASRGPDAVVLAGGHGATPLSAHDPRTLEPLMRYPTDAPARVAAIIDVTSRARFVVAFGDRPELWEIAYDRNAPAVLRGLVHDYRMGEAVALPGRLTPRPFAVPGASRGLVPGANAFEVLRLDIGGALGVVNLDVRREIERPSLEAPRSSSLVTAWSEGARRGWLVATARGEARLLEAVSWRVATLDLHGPVRAVGRGAGPAESLVVAGAPSAIELLRVDASQARVRSRADLPAAAATVERIVTGSDGRCAALLDAGGRWVGQVGVAR